MCDLDASLAFYRDRLGLEYEGASEIGGPEFGRLIRTSAERRGRTAMLSTGPGQTRIELVEWTPTTPAPGRSRTGADPGVAIVSFLLRAPALQALYERLRPDHVCWSEPVDLAVGATTVRAFVVEDPDGNAIEFFALPG